MRGGSPYNPMKDDRIKEHAFQLCNKFDTVVLHEQQTRYKTEFNMSLLVIVQSKMEGV